MILKGYSTRKDGNMYLSAEYQNPRNIANRKRFFKSLGLQKNKIVAANLVHGTNVATIDSSSPDFLLNTDALITKEKNIVLTLTGADCFPVCFEDAKNNIIGIAHCGWRGIIAGIVPKTIDHIVSLGGQKENIKIKIGSGICTNHFEIQNDIVDSFSDYSEAIEKTSGKTHIDLRRIITRQAIKLGITEENISREGECTFCLPEKYFSYRRDKPASLETQVAYIVIRQKNI